MKRTKWSLLSLMLNIVFSPIILLALLLDGIDGRWTKEYLVRAAKKFMGFEYTL